MANRSCWHQVGRSRQITLHVAVAIEKARTKRAERCELTIFADKSRDFGFFEAGFADRVVATELANLFPDVQNRSQARVAARREAGAVRAALSGFPSYFSAVLDEMAAG